MSRDDYFVLVYQILAYLYTCLKEGQQAVPEYLNPDSPLLGINEQYWTYIMTNMLKQGYIEGITVERCTIFGGSFNSILLHFCNPLLIFFLTSCMV